MSMLLFQHSGDQHNMKLKGFLLQIPTPTTQDDFKLQFGLYSQIVNFLADT